MARVTIVGGGFGAALAKLKSKDRDFETISTTNSQNLAKLLVRRSEIEANKLFSEKAYSYGDLSFNVGSLKLHDRIIRGGNTKI